MNSYNSRNNYSMKNCNNMNQRYPMSTMPSDCGCRDVEKAYSPATCLYDTALSQLPLAMAYVPVQNTVELYEPCKALYEGTAFPCLNKPFCGVRG